jgi:hypothetical protein
MPPKHILVTTGVSVDEVDTTFCCAVTQTEVRSLSVWAALL